MSSPCVDERAEYGVGLLEEGHRDFKEWSAKMRGDLAGHTFTDGDLQRLWNEARLYHSEQIKGMKGDVVPAKSDIFIDQVAKSLTREGAARFATALMEPDGTSPILDKLADGSELTDAELTRAAQAYEGARPENAPGKPNIGPLRDIQGEAARLRRSSRLIERETPVNRLIRAITQRVGSDKTQAMRKTLAVDGKDTILAKIATGQKLTDAETLKARNAFSRAAEYEPPKPTDAAKEAIREAQAQSREVAKQHLAESRTVQDVFREWGYKNLPDDKIEPFLSRLDSLKSDDIKGLSDLYRQSQPSSLGSKVVQLYRAGLLTGIGTLGKISSSHLTLNLMEEASKLPSALVDMTLSRIAGTDRQAGGASVAALYSAARSAAKKGIPDALYLVQHGDTALAIKHMAEGDTSLLAQMHNRDGIEGLHAETWFNNPILRAYAAIPFRVHGGIYTVVKAFGIEQAIHEQASLAAMNEAATLRRGGGSVPSGFVKERTAHYTKNPSDTMATNAIQSVEEMTLINQNALSKTHARVLQSLQAEHPVAVNVINLAIPFFRVPTNAVLKTLEYAAGGAYHGARLGSAVLRSGELHNGLQAALKKALTPELQRQFSKGVGRNVIGSLFVTAGYQLYKAGYLQPSYDVRKGEHPGTFKIGDHYFRIEGAAPAGTLLTMGANIAVENEGRKPNYAPVGMSAIADQPLVRNANETVDISRPASKHRASGFDTLINNEALSTIPTIVREGASTLDGGRKVDTYDPNSEMSTLGRTLQSGIPGLRNRLPTKPTHR